MPPAQMKPRTIDALPQELIEAIVDALVGDQDHRALQACSLAARRWLPRARYHLHGTFTLRHRNFCVHPAYRKRLLDTPGAALRVGLAADADAVTDSDVLDVASEALGFVVPSVLAYARTLHIRGEPSNMCFPAGELEADSHGSHHPLALTDSLTDRDTHHAHAHNSPDSELFWLLLAHLLRHVRTVRISELYCGDVPVAETARLCGALRGVEHLALSDCEFRDPGELRGVLAACAGLRTLKLEWIFWSHDFARSSAGHAMASASRALPSATGMLADTVGPPLFAKLEELQVGYCARKMDESIVEIFASAESSLSITKLSLGPTDLDIEMLPSWVRVVGPSLEVLNLSFGQIARPEVARKVSGCLKDCSQLRKLVLCAKPWRAAASLSSIFTNPNFWPCSLEILGSAIGIGSLSTVEFVWTAREVELSGSGSTGRTEVLERIQEVLLAKSGHKRTARLDFILTTRMPGGEKRSSSYRMF